MLLWKSKLAVYNDPPLGKNISDTQGSRMLSDNDYTGGVVILQIQTRPSAPAVHGSSE